MLDNSDHIQKMMPPAIEAMAAKQFEEVSIERMHQHLAWKKLPIEVKNVWRIRALIDECNRWRK